VEEVARYYDVFWVKYEQLADWTKTLERIEKGEQKIKRREATESLVAAKVASSPDPFRAMVIPYGTNRVRAIFLS
jgi:hypothetical protein